MNECRDELDDVKIIRNPLDVGERMNWKRLKIAKTHSQSGFLKEEHLCLALFVEREGRTVRYIDYNDYKIIDQFVPP